MAWCTQLLRLCCAVNEVLMQDQHNRHYRSSMICSRPSASQVFADSRAKQQDKLVCCCCYLPFFSAFSVQLGQM